MTSLDDRLRELIRTGGPDEGSLRGDVTEVRARARRRARRRRAAAGALGTVVAVLGVAGVVWVGGNRGPNVVSDDTTLPQSPPGSTVPTTASRPRPSIRDVDFGEMTYDAACDGRAATLAGGIARLPGTDEAHYEVSLGAVGYADAEGDGDEDALVLLQCTYVGPETDDTLQLRVYGIGAGGRAALIGSPQVLENYANSSVEGMTATVVVDTYPGGVPDCCPTGRARQVWRFDGSGFVLVSSADIPQPGAS